MIFSTEEDQQDNDEERINLYFLGNQYWVNERAYHSDTISLLVEDIIQGTVVAFNSSLFNPSETNRSASWTIDSNNYTQWGCGIVNIPSLNNIYRAESCKILGIITVLQEACTNYMIPPENNALGCDGLVALKSRISYTNKCFSV